MPLSFYYTKRCVGGEGKKTWFKNGIHTKEQPKINLRTDKVESFSFRIKTKVVGNGSEKKIYFKEKRDIDIRRSIHFNVV